MSSRAFVQVTGEFKLLDFAREALHIRIIIIVIIHAADDIDDVDDDVDTSAKSEGDRDL